MIAAHHCANHIAQVIFRQFIIINNNCATKTAVIGLFDRPLRCIEDFFCVIK